MNILERPSLIMLAKISALLLLAALTAVADPVNFVDPATLTPNQQVSFTGLTSGYHDDLISVGGVTFGERFAGQTLSSSNFYDVLDASASGPLTPTPGAPSQNLYVLVPPYASLLGCGSRTCELIDPPAVGIIGEGSVAVRFPWDQSAFTLEVLYGAAGELTLDFFRGDGSHIGQAVVSTPSPSGISRATFGFSRDGGLADIAGFSVYNNAFGGIGLVALDYSTPEPATWLCLASGMALLLARRRRATG